MGDSQSRPGRRQFMTVAGSAGAALFAGAVKPARAGFQGANDRIRMALIGSGSRGRSVTGSFLQHGDVECVAACDVYRERLDLGLQTIAKAQPGRKVEAYEDYRHILDRGDIDALLVATPDHWHHKIVIDAISAGKDVYVEKPLSNTVERAVEALRAYRNSNRVVQVGTQQRSMSHFQEAGQLVQEGQLGRVTHAVLQFGGSGYGSAPEQPVPVPDGLNWDLFQGPAPRRPFKQGRLRWRGWWDYGGGLITDWGVHLTDVALWYLGAQRTGPLLTSGVAQYVNFENPERDQSPDAFSVSWQYPDFVMTFTNAVVQDWEFGRQGNYFYGPNGSLLVHRAGYELRPTQGRRGGPPPAAASTGRGATQPLQPRRVPFRDPAGGDSGSGTLAHVRDFLDCVKSRQKPVSDLEIGFYASLPCLLAVQAIREGRSLKWDEQAAAATAS